MPEFTHLFIPGKIGKLELKNRVIFPPLATHMATEEGDITDYQIDYYAERARKPSMRGLEPLWRSRGILRRTFTESRAYG